MLYASLRRHRLKFCDLTQFYSPVSGGVKRYLEQKVAYLRRSNPDDEHLLIVPGERTEVVRDGQSCVCTIASPLVSRTSRYRALMALHLVEEILDRERPDIIESGDPYQVAWKAVASGRALGIPTVGFYHSHFPEASIRSVSKYFGRLAVEMAEDLARRYICALYNRFEATLVPSPALRELLEDWGVENTIDTDLGVDTEIFHPSGGDGGARAELDVPPDKTLLLYVGRLAPEKNLKVLFSAFVRLQSEAPGKFHLLAVGDGNSRAQLVRLREQTGAVSWMPYVGEARRLADLYRASDLFVHPGVVETFGLVTLEAQACGTPVIGIRGSYMDRIVFTNQMRWAAENTAEALARAIRETAETDLRADGLDASRAVLDGYSWNAIFGRLFSVYREIIANYSP